MTEWIAGVNLPATQLSIAMGIPLWRLPGENVIELYVEVVTR